MDKNTFESGFTLIELIAAMAIGLIVIGSIYGLFISEQKMYSLQDQMIEMQQSVRSSMDIITKKLQMAGYDPQETKKFGITDSQFLDSNTVGLSITTDAELYFTTDNLDGDGVIDNTGDERFGFKIEANTLKIANISTVDGSISSWRNIAENIESMTAAYTYANGSSSSGTTDLPNNGVSGKNFNDVRVVTVFLTARTSKTDPKYIDPIKGDNYRRMTLKSEITPRNLGISDFK
ncbi:MAG: prepilin-type N-terminal cleavage/methylation domain-containing protein [Nitrospinae bacterium]|nr:prepilin-type N-terminal cleavage/methylation domain-containing protein [Nitrospinota bacterium]